MQYFLEKCRNNYFTDQHMLFPPPVLMENKPGGLLFFSLTGLLICPYKKHPAERLLNASVLQGTLCSSFSVKFLIQLGGFFLKHGKQGFPVYGRF